MLRMLATLLLLGLGLVGLAALVGGYNPADLVGMVYGEAAQTREKAYLLAGVGIGIGLGVIGRVRWLELPRLVLYWLIAHRRNFKWLCYGIACAAFLVLY